ncbi:hypothetical protein ACFYT3_31295 [Nocardia amikacinitolerans]|uniref:hypothetical protein n=1 Tax=Nocardia amikacinitolerans TaxID=756689 RepID=UPI00369F481D
MTATTTTPDVAAPDAVPTVSPFADALGEIEYLLDTDPDRARERFTAVLALASPQEREFLDQAADILTLHPYKVAARQLGWMAKSRPELRGMITDLTADSDPDLHRPALPDPPQVSIEAAEWVRRSIRERRNRDRTTATPSPATDAARLSPAAIAYRRARRPIPGAVNLRHRDRDQRSAERRRLGEAEFAAYAADRLFAIDTETEPDRSMPVPDPRKPAHLVWAHVQAGLWERSYFLHVAENYSERDRELLAPKSLARPAKGQTQQGRHTALDEAASAFLREREADVETVDDRRASRRRTTALPRRISTADQTRFAARRTGLPVPDDYDEFLPYSELDVTETTWEGSGLDYDLAAMTPYLGWPCVGCWIDRPATDRRAIHIRDGRRVSDDGLCDVCRADGHPGIPPLPAPWGIPKNRKDGPPAAGLSREEMQQFVESRCAYIAATHPQQVRAILDRIRAAAANTGPTWRIITRWMAMNLEQPTVDRLAPRRAAARRRRPAALGAGQRIGRCDACARPGVVHADNYCTGCRIDLGLVPVRERATSAA